MADTSFSDSYIETDAELETLIGSDPRTAAAALKAATAGAQEWYCAEATRRIDALSLRGTKWDLTTLNGVPAQTLEFPRAIDGVGVGNGEDFVTDPDVPDWVKQACKEEAIAIYASGAGGGRRELQEQGVQSYSIGGKLSETFRAGAGTEGLQSPQARRLMRRYMGAEVR
jgi:hypothetical protein